MAKEDVDGITLNLSTFLSSDQRDFLIRNNGDQVKISSLDGKIVGLYVTANTGWKGVSYPFHEKLVEVYKSKVGEFEVVMVSWDIDEDTFQAHFSKMPWLAIPFDDEETRTRLTEYLVQLGATGIFNYLAIVDSNGKLWTESANWLLNIYGVDGYPFTQERMNFLKEQEEEARRNQSLSSILVSGSRDYLLSNNGNQIPVSQLQGKMVGLYFSSNDVGPRAELNATFVEFYNKLKERGEEFEIVYISMDDNEKAFKQGFEKMPWLALPYDKKSIEKLCRHFNCVPPTLVIIGPDGKTLNPNVRSLVIEYDIDAYPFTPEKIAALPEIEKARQESQTLESLLVSRDNDFVIRNNGSKVPVSELVGKNIILYFTEHWCQDDFTSLLVKTYHEIKTKDDAFEVVFISGDHDQSSFDEDFSIMPWLALPNVDSRKKHLYRIFKINQRPRIPLAIAIGPSGRTVTEDAHWLISCYGTTAYPFTEEQLKPLEEHVEEMAKGWPQKLKHELHNEHELVLTRRKQYYCNACGEMGLNWSFYCDNERSDDSDFSDAHTFGEPHTCNFDLHPKCALEKNEDTNVKEGFVCEGDV